MLIFYIHWPERSPALSASLLHQASSEHRGIVEDLNHYYHFIFPFASETWRLILWQFKSVEPRIIGALADSASELAHSLAHWPRDLRSMKMNTARNKVSTFQLPHAAGSAFRGNRRKQDQTSNSASSSTGKKLNTWCWKRWSLLLLYIRSKPHVCVPCEMGTGS